MVAAAYSQPCFNAQWKHDIWIEKREWERRERKKGRARKKNVILKKRKKEKKQALAMVVLLTQASKSAGWEREKEQELVRQ